MGGEVKGKRTGSKSEPDARCSVTVNRGHGRWTNLQPCGRPVERDGKCKLHLRADERRAERSREYEAKAARGAALCAEAQRLSEKLGVAVSADYSWSKSDYTGAFVVPGDWLRALANERP